MFKVIFDRSIPPNGGSPPVVGSFPTRADAHAALKAVGYVPFDEDERENEDEDEWENERRYVWQFAEVVCEAG